MSPAWTHPVELDDLTAAPVHPDLARVMRQYSQISEGRAMPHRAHFRPSKLRWMMGRLYLVDVLEGGADYRFRLFGIFWQTVYSADLTGLRLSQIEPFCHLASLRGDYDGIVAQGIPALHLRRVRWPNDGSLEFQRLLLPFCDDGGQVSLILGAAACDKVPEEVVYFKGEGVPELLPGEPIRSGKPH